VVDKSFLHFGAVRKIFVSPFGKPSYKGWTVSFIKRPTQGALVWQRQPGD